MANRPSGYTDTGGPYAAEYGSPNFSHLSHLHKALLRAPRVADVEILIGDQDKSIGVILIGKDGLRIGYFNVLVDSDRSDVAIFSSFNFEEEEQHKGTFTALATGIVSWLDRTPFRKLVVRGRLTEEMAAACETIGLEEITHDDPSEGPILTYGSYLDDMDSKLHKKSNEWEEKHNV